MKIADRYVLRSFLGMFAGALAAISFLFTVFSILDSLSYLMRLEGATFAGVLRYYLLQLPQTIFMTAPIATLLSAMITLGLMNQRHELTALRAAGVSLMRTALPMLGAAALITLALFWLGNTLVPVGNRYLVSVKDAIKGEKSDPTVRLWYVSEARDRPPMVLRVNKLDRARGAILGVTVYETNQAFGLARLITAERADFENHRGWILQNARVREFNGQEVPRLSEEKELLLAINDKPVDFLRAQRAPEEMNLEELNDQIRRVRRYGLTDTAYRVERQARFAIPFAAMILVLTGAPLAIRPTRSAGLAVGILGAIVVGFVYFIIIAELLALGKGGMLPAWAAAWSANILFGMIGSGMFLTLRK